MNLGQFVDKCRDVIENKFDLKMVLISEEEREEFKTYMNKLEEMELYIFGDMYSSSRLRSDINKHELEFSMIDIKEYDCDYYLEHWITFFEIDIEE